MNSCASKSGTAQALEVHKETPHIKASFEKRQKQGWTTEIIPWRRIPEDVH